MVSTVDEAIEAASQLGYPLAMKIVSPDIIHKSDVGGVKLDLTTRARGGRLLRTDDDPGRARGPRGLSRGSLSRAHGGEGPGGHPGHDRDPQFGPMLMFGLGGIFVEVMQDVSFHLAPITSAEAMSMLMGTRSFKLLEGFRGEAKVDITVIAEALQRISQLVTDFPRSPSSTSTPSWWDRRGRNRWWRTHASSWSPRESTMA